MSNTDGIPQPRRGGRYIWDKETKKLRRVDSGQFAPGQSDTAPVRKNKSQVQVESE